MVKLVKMGKALKTTKSNKDQEYEYFQYGPLAIERSGRTISIKNIGSEKDLEKIKTAIEQKRPELKKSIDNDISSLIETIKKYNPVWLLYKISYENTITDPETYREITSTAQEARIEYALSLIASVKEVGKNEPDDKVVDLFNSTLEKVRRNVGDYFMTEKSDDLNEEEREMREWCILRLLGIRGNSFFEHHIDLVTNLFTPFNDFLNKHYGISVEDFFSCYKNIEKQIINNGEIGRKNYIESKKAHKLFKDFVKNNGKKYKSIKELRTAFNNLPEVKTIFKKMGNNPFPHLFKIKPNNPKEEIIYQLLSFSFGDNIDPFLSFKKTSGWPTNDSIIYRRPILFTNKEYYCFGPIIIYRNLIQIFESLIKSKDENFFRTYYQEKTRKEYLENKTLEYFKNLLPNSQTYKNLFYRPNIQDSNFIAETDGVVIYDNNIFIIEAKSGAVSPSARRGSLERIKSETTKLVDEAYQQALRTKDYINNTQFPVFENEKGETILKIENKDVFKNIFLITTTLDPLDHLSTQLNSLKSIGLIDGKEWPWTVFIDDLRVVSEIVEFPSEFISFLQHRIRANDFPQFRSIDELDFFMFFLKEGLYFEDGNLKKVDRFTPTGYTEDLDRYYDYIGGRVSSGGKPKISIDDDFIEFIKDIEKTNKLGFTQLTTCLLSINVDSQRELLKLVEFTKNKSAKENKTVDGSISFKEFGFTIVCIKDNLSREVVVDKICLKNKYNMKLPLWFLISFENGQMDFEIFEEEWKLDEKQEKNLDQFRRMMWQKIKLSGGKIERNEPCFCRSGKKYKKCCYLRGFVF